MEPMKKSQVPEGQIGDWKVTKFEVSEDGAMVCNLRSAINGASFMNITPGKYTKLTCGGVIVMSDTPMEMRMHSEIMYQAHGHVLLNGLGLGMIAVALAGKDEVKSVTIVELNEEVIRLVEPHIRHPKIKVVQGNAFTYRPELPEGGKFDAVWHDIWYNICEDNHEEMKKLHRRYGRWARWQGSWSRDQVEQMIERDKRQAWRWLK